MTTRHRQILADLDRKGAKHYCLMEGHNVVGAVSALVNGQRFRVTITKTRFGYFAAVSYDDRVYSKWSRTASGAVIALGKDLKERI